MPSSLHIIELTTNTVIEYVACHKLIDVYVLRNCIGLHNNNMYRIIILYEYLQNLKWLSVCQRPMIKLFGYTFFLVKKKLNFQSSKGTLLNITNGPMIKHFWLYFSLFLMISDEKVNNICVV